MAERSYRGLLWSLALVAILADQGTKYAVFAWLYRDGNGDHRVIIPDAFDLRAEFKDNRDPGTELLSALRTWGGDQLPRVNPGALFGWKFFGLANDVVANGVFAFISIIAAAAIIFWSTSRSMTRDGLLSGALGLILGGTLGNLYDRFVFGGVRDFLHWHGGFEWPVFNIADSCLVVGAFLLLTQALFSRPVEQAAPEMTTPANAPGENAAEVDTVRA